MHNKIRHHLPWIAVAALAVAIVSFLLVDRQIHGKVSLTDSNRTAVEAALAEVLALKPSSVADQAFQEAIDRFSHSPKVAYVWGIEANGVVFFSHVRFAPGDKIAEHATEETRRVLSELPDTLLSEQQRVAMLFASAIQSEGEHNDIFNHMVRPIRTAAGDALGFIGIAYARQSDGGGIPPLGYLLPLLLIPLGLATYWLVLVWWVFIDAKGRGEPAWIWACFVLLGNFVALFAYLLVRPREPKPAI